MSDRLLHTKVSKRKPLTHFPNKKDGHDGDMQIVSVSGKGTFLCIKAKGEWKISEKFNPRNKFDTHIFDEIVTQKIKSPGVFTIDTIGKTHINGSTIYLTPTDKPSGGVGAFLDFNNLATSTSNSLALGIDLDHTTICASGQTINNRGIDLDVNSNGAAHVGTVNNYGLDIDITGGTDGTQNNYGIHVRATGADTNTGLVIDTEGTHIKLEGSSYVGDYATFTLADTGDLTMATVGSGTTDSDITIDADGDITLDAAGLDINFAVGGAAYFNWNALGTFKMMNVSDVSKYFMIDITAGNAQTTIKTVEGSSAADITLQPAGDLLINHAPNKKVKIDKNSTNTNTQSQYGLIIDVDHTGIIADGETLTHTGLDLDINCESITHVGTVNQTGIDIDMVAATDGTQTNTGIDISCTGADTNTHLQLSHDATNYCSFATTANGATTIATKDSDGALAHLILDVDGDIQLNANGGQVTIKDDSANHFLFDCDATSLIIYDDTDEADLFSITVAASGVTTIATVDDGATVGHLTLAPDGDLILDPVSTKVIINATDDLFFDGGVDTYITENSADNLRFYVGGDLICSMAENGSSGNQINISGASAGFSQIEPTFDATDTDVDFRKSNKQKLTLTDNCADIHFQFPDMSGNFICVLLQDGTGGRTISNWKTKDLAGNVGDGNSGLVLWAGGTAPSNTETADKSDIVSIYWDNDNEIAYGTYTYNF